MKRIPVSSPPACATVALADLAIAGLLALLAVSGCARSDRPGRGDAAKDKPAAAAAKAPEVRPQEAPPVEAKPVTQPPATPATEALPTAEKPPAKADAPPTKAPPDPGKSAAPAEPAPKKETKAAAPAKPAAPPLDLASLEQRLKDTDAIGFMTKLTLKNQVDDLLGRFEAHYDGTHKASLIELRQPFDLLIIKVLSLLQDRDAALAGAISASREALWSILSDAARFRSFLNQNRR